MNVQGQTLRIVIIQEWFDEIAMGKKKTEYREMKPFWNSRLFNKDGTRKQFKYIEFINGYNKNALRLITEYRGFAIRDGKYHIRIGKILKKPFFGRLSR